MPNGKAAISVSPNNYPAEGCLRLRYPVLQPKALNARKLTHIIGD
jgi:hypothetical protein